METGWLIDDTQNQQCLGVMAETIYWVPYTSTYAVRFARKADAARMLSIFRTELEEGLGRTIDTVEHGWG